MFRHVVYAGTFSFYILVTCESIIYKIHIERCSRKFSVWQILRYKKRTFFWLLLFIHPLLFSRCFFIFGLCRPHVWFAVKRPFVTFKTIICTNYKNNLIFRSIFYSPVNVIEVSAVAFFALFFGRFRLSFHICFGFSLSRMENMMMMMAWPPS